MTNKELYYVEKGSLTCKDIEKLYGEYFDNELPPSLKDKMGEHIHLCDECREFARTYEMTVSLAKELKQEPMQDDVKRRLREKLNATLGIKLPLA